MSRTLLPRGALSAYSAAVDHVLRVDESTCRAEGVRISSGSFIPPILVGWFRPGGPRRRSARNEGAAAQAGFPRLNPCDPYALQGVPSGDERKIIIKAVVFGSYFEVPPPVRLFESPARDAPSFARQHRRRGA